MIFVPWYRDSKTVLFVRYLTPPCVADGLRNGLSAFQEQAGQARAFDQQQSPVSAGGGAVQAGGGVHHGLTCSSGLECQQKLNVLAYCVDYYVVLQW